jgi:hypothetical protein
LTTDVLIGQAKLAFDEKNYQKAESFLLRAHRPELAVKLYKVRILKYRLLTNIFEKNSNLNF